jgi:hypothetical protein
VSPDTIFRIANFGILPFWILLALAPRWRGTQLVVHSALVPVLLGVLYAVLLFGDLGNGDGDMTSLRGVMAIFDSPQTVVAAWIHYLIFDLFIGAWQVRDAARRRIPHWMVVPCLALTLFFGPVGLVAYLALRFARTRATTLQEQ